jgi:hypothetical protein
VVTDDCWACDRGVPHVHRTGADCPHERSDGTEPPCCGDERAAHVALLALDHNLRTGRTAVPDAPAGARSAPEQKA